MGSGVRHNSPPSPRGGGGNGSGGSPTRPPASARSRGDCLARGTRLVSVRAVAVPLAREVEREQFLAMTDLNQKLVESLVRMEGAKQAAHVAPQERDFGRAQSKLA